MAAICACLNRNHRPYVDVGNPNLSDDTNATTTDTPTNTVSMQVISIFPPTITESSEVICIDANGTLRLVKVDWLLAFSCELCN